MELITDVETGERYINTGIRDSDGETIRIIDMNGYGATDIGIDWHGGISWRNFEKLKEAFLKAEKLFKRK